MNSFTKCDIAKFVAKFLSENGSEKLAAKWNDQDNMEAFKAVVLKATKRGNEKKLKDPLKPKRGKSAYLFFCAAKREEAKKRLEDGAKVTDVTAELGRMWKQLKASEKKADKKALEVFEAEAVEDKSRYQEAMEEYEPPSDEELQETKKKSKKTSDKDPNAPKRGKTAYIYFCSAKRAEAKEELGDGAKGSDVMTQLGKMWKELKNDSDRADELAEFTQMAVDDKARYDDEKKDYTPSEQSIKPVSKKEKKVSKPSPKTDSEEEELIPKKKTGYSYYCSYNREGVKEENPEMTGKQVTSELACQWKELSKEEKKEWSDSAAALTV